jgi:hypothetical protein
MDDMFVQLQVIQYFFQYDVEGTELTYTTVRYRCALGLAREHPKSTRLALCPPTRSTDLPDMSDATDSERCLSISVSSPFSYRLGF